MLEGLTFLIGGARSGKSNLAVELGARHGASVVFIATAEAIDDDMAQRIARHRAERPEWPTREVPVALAQCIRELPEGALAIVDCLTVWVANLYAHSINPAQRGATYDELVDVVGERRDPTIVISNEVGLGLHPETPLTREYRDELGRLNQRIAAVAHRTLFLVAGRAVQLGDPLEMLS
ncbi:MAG: adenosylcobinamide kinase/adenosylcobinamide-phosphate guanylyltransferase [Actinomycetota bacterium]